MMKTLIKDVLKKRNQILKEDYDLNSGKICKSIIEMHEFVESENLLVFNPYLNEADIWPFINEAVVLGKQTYFPKVISDTEMIFVFANKPEDFKEGYKGIKEPIGTIVFDKNNISGKTLMVLPGSVFDYRGNRCGYGKGYYDRYLENCSEHIVKVGVCFSIQMIDEITDIKPTDIPMDYVVNEKEIVRR